MNVVGLVYPHTQNAPLFRAGMDGGLKFSSKIPHPSGWGVGVYTIGVAVTWELVHVAN